MAAGCWGPSPAAIVVAVVLAVVSCDGIASGLSSPVVPDCNDARSDQLPPLPQLSSRSVAGAADTGGTVMAASAEIDELATQRAASDMREGSMKKSVPVISLAPLSGSDPVGRSRVVQEIGQACRTVGFFYVKDHGVPFELQNELEGCARSFFALPTEEKMQVRMDNGGKAWRGFFRVGDEQTSSVPDEKEGLYFGTEPADSADPDPRPMHGPNQFPAQHPEMRPLVLKYMAHMKRVGGLILVAIAESLGLEPTHFGKQFENPVELFRIFNYPPHDDQRFSKSYGVGLHQDYGYVTLLRQEEGSETCLQAQTLDGEFIDVPPITNTFVINLGDALEHNTGGLLRATPHRVLPRTSAKKPRMSFPYFYDPGWDAEMVSVVDALAPELQQAAAEARARQRDRWDNRRPEEFTGTYGQYLLSKVAGAFPSLFEDKLAS